MRKLTSAVILIIILSMMAGCGTVSKPAGDSLTKNISLEQTESILVSTQPKKFDPIELTDPSDIEQIILYLNGLSISKAPPPSPSGGMSYHIDITDNNGKVINVVLYGNKWIRVDSSPSYIVPYDEAIVFRAIIGNILLNRYRDEFDGTIVRGEVISVSAEESGGTNGCEIKTDDGALIAIDMSNVFTIIDIRGSGWLILHEGDIVEIGIDTYFVADKVFITDTAM